jgi:hypothetical protein
LVLTLFTFFPWIFLMLLLHAGRYSVAEAVYSCFA